METTKYLTVKNWSSFQHYKDRTTPSWIKLYAALLSDYEFTTLPDESKAHLVMIWLLLSQRRDRKIPYDPKWIGQHVGATAKVDINLLISKGFLIPIDPPLEVPYQSDEKDSRPPSTPDKRREEESRGEENSPSDLGDADAPLTEQDLVDGWNEICVPAGLARVAEITYSRRKKLTVRIREHPDVAWWERVMNNIAGSLFLRGLRSTNGHEKWRASFDWLIENDTNALKVYEGRYHDASNEKVRHIH